MRKRFYVVGALAAFLVSGFATAGPASAENVQQITGKAAPRKAPTNKFVPAVMTVRTNVFGSSRGKAATGNAGLDGFLNTPGAWSAAQADTTPRACCDSPNPAPATLALIDFDRFFRFNLNVRPKCPIASLLGKSTAGARAACPRSVVGQGTSLARPVAADPSVPASFGNGPFLGGVVTAFLGRLANGRPGILLHNATTGATPVVLPGDMIKSPLPGYGQRLRVAVPDLPGGTPLLTFQTTIRKTIKRIVRRKNGKKRVIRRALVSAKCAGNARWKFSGTFLYKSNAINSEGSPPKTATHRQVCKKKRPKRTRR